MESPASLASYQVLTRLGEGSLCEVHLARAPGERGELIALKVLKTEVASPRTRELFAAELRALERLDHPHVAKVLDSGTTEADLPYCAMEYVPGQSLTTFCAAARLGLHARIKLFQQVCEAVEHANSRGVVHRDLKPENVLVTLLEDRPFVKLIDFNLASLTGADELADVSGSIVGTPAYMSPEQANPAARSVDPRSDVYSLGVLLYQLLADSLPFGDADLVGAGVAGMQRTLNERIPTAPSDRVMDESAGGRRSRRIPGAAGKGTRAGRVGARLARQGARVVRRFHGLRLRGDLEAVVLRALEKRPEARYASAQALRDDLQRYLDGRQLAARAGNGLTGRVRHYLTRPDVAFRIAAFVLISAAAQLFGTVKSHAPFPEPPRPGGVDARLARIDCAEQDGASSACLLDPAHEVILRVRERKTPAS
ncbi:MAG TPA: serine/threonine-protein kinase [Planctomycetota bacterium]